MLEKKPGTHNTFVARKEAPAKPPSDLQRLIEDLKALKVRALTFEIQKLEDQYKGQIDQAVKGAEQRSRTGNLEEVRQLQQETRRILERELQSSKDLLTGKFDKIDQGLMLLLSQVNALTSLQERETELAAREAAARKLEEEAGLKTRELESLKAETEKKSKEADERLARTEVEKRAVDLDQLKEELEAKLKAYQGEMANVERQRDELNKDFDKLGLKRAELDNEAEALREDRKKLEEEKRGVGAAVAHDMASAVEVFLNDLLRKRSEAALNPPGAAPIIRAGPASRRGVPSGPAGSP